jgi:hypothetical protein
MADDDYMAEQDEEQDIMDFGEEDDQRVPCYLLSQIMKSNSK